MEPEPTPCNVKDCKDCNLRPPRLGYLTKFMPYKEFPICTIICTAENSVFRKMSFCNDDGSECTWVCDKMCNEVHDTYTDAHEAMDNACFGIQVSEGDMEVYFFQTSNLEIRVNDIEIPKGTRLSLKTGDVFSINIGEGAKVYRYYVTLAPWIGVPVDKRIQTYYSFLPSVPAGPILAFEYATSALYDLKVLSPQQVETLGPDKQEFDLLKAVQDHENILGLKAIFQDNENYFLVKYLHDGGQTLENSVQTHGVFTEAECKVLARQILSAAKHMHARNVIHRDIRPANILLVKDDPVVCKVTGFARSVVSGASGKIFDKFSGDRAYVAPEMIANYNNNSISYTNKCDVWNIGCTIYYILTSWSPIPALASFDEDPDRIPFGPLEQVGASQECIQFLQTLIELNFDKRPSAAEALELPWLKDDEIEPDAWTRDPPHYSDIIGTRAVAMEYAPSAVLTGGQSTATGTTGQSTAVTTASAPLPDSQVPNASNNTPLNGNNRVDSNPTSANVSIQPYMFQFEH